MECRSGGARGSGNTGAEARSRIYEREEGEMYEEDATHYIIVGSWHSSRARSLIHAWNSHESH